MNIFGVNIISHKLIGGIFINAFPNETHSNTAEVTEHPVEDGAVISDHIINKPLELSINGIVNDFFIDAYDALKQLMTDKELVIIVTGLKVYTDMAITSFEVDRDSVNGGSLEFSMTLSQVKNVIVGAISATQIDKEIKQAELSLNFGLL